MIYVVHSHNSDDPYESPVITATFDTDLDIEKEHRHFIIKEAEKREIIINIYHFNIADHKKYHSDLTDIEYKEKKKKWDKFLRNNSLTSFAIKNLNLKPLDFKKVYEKTYD